MTVIAPSTVMAKSLSDEYKDVRASVVGKFGQDTAGRHIIKDGVRFKWVSADGSQRHWGSRRATTSEIARSVRTYRRWLSPPAPVASVTDSKPTTATTSQPQYAGGKWSIPSYIVMCESGGNYRALNPSGAGGAYQIMPGTWRAFGGSNVAPQNASPAEQDQIAGRIYRAQGAAPWVCG